MRTAEARPASRVSLQVNGKSLRFRKAVVATGGRALIPQIDGLENVPYLTNANLFNLVDLPPRLVIIGAGPSSHRLGDPNSAPAQVRTDWGIRTPHRPKFAHEVRTRGTDLHSDGWWFSSGGSPVDGST